jgi:hypothetical protein
MADPTFVALTEDLRLSYVPMPSPITPVRMQVIKSKMVEIGATLDNLDVRHHDTVRCLRYIFMSAMDMLQCEDYQKLFDDIILLHTKKNAGYAGVGATDPWANFRPAEWFDVSPLLGCLIRMGDKIIRVRNLNENPNADQVNESITDTLQDLAVYCIVAMCLTQEEVSGVRKRETAFV